MSYNFGSFGREYRKEDIVNATSVSELRPFLCWKSRGDASECRKCQDSLCSVGVRVRELLKNEVGKDDPDYDVLNSGFHFSRPIYWLVKNKDLLSHSPNKFNRNDALRFIKNFFERYPGMELSVIAENALHEERRFDYNRYMKLVDGIGQEQAQRTIAKDYKITFNEATPYISSLKKEFGVNEAKVIPDSKDAGNSYFSDKMLELYESLQSEAEQLDIRWQNRLEEIDSQIKVIEKAIETYTNMITAIQKTEKLIVFCGDTTDDAEPTTIDGQVGMCASDQPLDTPYVTIDPDLNRR